MSYKDKFEKNYYAVENLRKTIDREISVSYDDFNSEFNNLVNIIKKRKKYSKEDVDKISEIQHNYWHAFIMDMIDILFGKTEKKKYKGVDFSNIKIKLKQLKNRIETSELQIKDYENIYDGEIDNIKIEFISKLKEFDFSMKKHKSAILIGWALGILTSLLFYFLDRII